MRWSLLAAIVLPGGVLIGLASGLRWYLRHRAARELAHAEALIAANRAKPLHVGADEALRERTNKRREAADGIRRRAAHVESGAPVADVIRMVKRG